MAQGLLIQKAFSFHKVHTENPVGRERRYKIYRLWNEESSLPQSENSWENCFRIVFAMKGMALGTHKGDWHSDSGNVDRTVKIIWKKGG